MSSQPTFTPVSPHPLREAACLVHSVPGVTLRLSCRSGSEVLVSYSCLGADLDPCRLRAAIIHERRPARLAAAIARVELVAGLRPLGAGLYQRRAAGVDERWFVTTLHPERAVAVLRDGPERFHTTIKPDTELGMHAVCVRPVSGPARAGAAIDEAAVWALATVLTGELAAELERHRPSSRSEHLPPPNDSCPTTLSPHSTQPILHKDLP